ncbi:hypothetical protein ACQP2E_17145 [Actinoplanes sp. CA-015351]|uniref:hypothetical protein n=1 Tax=Actinoplanes sp. CA-015351 TaxID=3239897 RepID=UPI003D96D0F6
MTARTVRVALLAAGCAVLGAVALCGPRASPEAPPAAPVSAPASQAVWKTIEYRGVRVDVPGDWEQANMSACSFSVHKWAPPGAPACDPKTGVVFYGSATFDPAHGPGLREAGSETWAGYVYAGAFAVYATSTDRALVQRILDSAP